MITAVLTVAPAAVSVLTRVADAVDEPMTVMIGKPVSWARPSAVTVVNSDARTVVSLAPESRTNGCETPSISTWIGIRVAGNDTTPPSPTRPRPPPSSVKSAELPGVSTPSVAISIGGIPRRNA